MLLTRGLLSLCMTPTSLADAHILTDALHDLPKVELHVHLEGTISAATAAGLARAHGVDPERALVLEGGTYPDPFRDFPHFVETFLATAAQVREPADLTTVAAAFVAEQARQQVRWCEVTFTAVTMAQRGWTPEAMWSALAAGLATRPDVGVGLILDTPRDLGADVARASVELARSALEAGLPVIALGLTGVEGSVHEREFVLLRHAADELGIGLVVHAGEMGTPDNVAAAIDVLRADRIGHGIATVHDDVLLERVARSGIVLEVCPSSNVTLGIIPSLEVHPIVALRDAGVAITVNSDDPPFFSTTLTDELGHAARLLGLDASGLVALQRRAIDASFAPAEVRTRVHAELDTWLAAST
jgi:aminodeoxyfutalosine deaminase